MPQHVCHMLMPWTLLTQGKLHEAATMYARAGAQDRAIAMFRDMRMFRQDDVSVPVSTVMECAAPCQL